MHGGAALVRIGSVEPAGGGALEEREQDAGVPPGGELSNTILTGPRRRPPGR